MCSLSWYSSFPTRCSSDLFRDAARVGVLDDHAGWAASGEFRHALVSRVGVVDIVVGELLALYNINDTDAAYECVRSEEHTSELQSPMYLVCRLLLEKKKDF